MKSIRVNLYMIVEFLLAGSSFGNTIAFSAPPSKEDQHAGVTQNWDKIYQAPLVLACSRPSTIRPFATTTPA